MVVMMPSLIMLMMSQSKNNAKPDTAKETSVYELRSNCVNCGAPLNNKFMRYGDDVCTCEFCGTIQQFRTKL